MVLAEGSRPQDSKDATHKFGMQGLNVRFVPENDRNMSRAK
jgi:hypothetical protein